MFNFIKRIFHKSKKETRRVNSNVNTEISISKSNANFAGVLSRTKFEKSYKLVDNFISKYSDGKKVSSDGWFITPEIISFAKRYVTLKLKSKQPEFNELMVRLSNV